MFGEANVKRDAVRKSERDWWMGRDRPSRRIFSQRVVLRSTRFRNSRTLPGQTYDSAASSTVAPMPLSAVPKVPAQRSAEVQGNVVRALPQRRPGDGHNVDTVE